MYTLFISDLHLDPSHPELTTIFLELLEGQARQADALYILGDFFEIWVGDDDITPFKNTIIQALKALTQTGVKVYFLHGNRDFLLGQDFCQQTGCVLLPDPSIIDLYGTRTVLTHGDTLCTEDVAYQKFRCIIRNRLIQWLFLRLPLPWRQKTAQHLRKRSKASHGSQDTWADAASAAIQELIKTTQAQLLIHGHTHRPSIERIYGQMPYERIVLSDWEDKGNVLFYYSDKPFRLIDLKK